MLAHRRLCNRNRFHFLPHLRRPWWRCNRQQPFRSRHRNHRHRSPVPTIRSCRRPTAPSRPPCRSTNPCSYVITSACPLRPACHRCRCNHHRVAPTTTSFSVVVVAGTKSVHANQHRSTWTPCDAWWCSRMRCSGKISACHLHHNHNTSTSSRTTILLLPDRHRGRWWPTWRNRWGVATLLPATTRRDCLCLCRCVEIFSTQCRAFFNVIILSNKRHGHGFL